MHSTIKFIVATLENQSYLAGMQMEMHTFISPANGFDLWRKKIHTHRDTHGMK